MPEPAMPNAGNAELVKVGHTKGTKYGTNLSAKERGASTPTEITYGGGGSK